jgi:hypothetical protein
LPYWQISTGPLQKKKPKDKILNLAQWQQQLNITPTLANQIDNLRLQQHMILK